ncbi:hypothetical protein G6F68_015748 [Rhizopus microsporus]|nr:hypothetical protein G6F68_015748 [Rhizopus microsporus]
MLKNTRVNRNANTTARIPFLTFSAPRLGPTTRSSTKSIGAASEPDFSSLARSSASFFCRPVVWKFLPNTPLMLATEPLEATAVAMSLPGCETALPMMPPIG